MSRFYVYRRALFFDWRRKKTTFINKHVDNKKWHLREEWHVRLGLDHKPFGRDRIWYDGITYQSVTLLFIEFGHGYGYDSRPLSDWSEEELAEPFCSEKHHTNTTCPATAGD